MQTADIWADLEGDFEAEAARTPAERHDAMERETLDTCGTLAAPTYQERCSKCAGSGRFRSYAGRDCGACFVCKGAGLLTRRTSPEARQKAKASKLARETAKRADWAAQHPEAAQWIAAKAGKFGFAASMAEALAKYHHLTERQLETVERLRLADVARDAQFAAERAEREASAPVVTIEAVEAAFATAQAAGIKSPKLRLGDFRFSPAKASSPNAGAIYVKRGDDYLGKVAGGKFVRAFACDAVTAAEVVAVASDPKQAAVAYGKRFGACSCCGKELTNAASIALGIGPICAGKFGW